MILSICFASIHSIDLLSASSVWHVLWVACAIEIPSARNHVVEVRVAFDVTGDMIVVFDEFIQSNLIVPFCLIFLIVVLLKGLHEFNKHFFFGSFA